jgi:hypothetical protein
VTDASSSTNLCIELFLVARAVLEEQMNKPNNRRNSGSGSAATLPSRTFRYLQDQYNNDSDNNTTSTSALEESVVAADGNGLRRGSNGHLPSRSFKYLQDQYDQQKGPVNRTQLVNNRDDLMEIYNKRKRFLVNNDRSTNVTFSTGKFPRTRTRSSTICGLDCPIAFVSFSSNDDSRRANKQQQCTSTHADEI